jgi:acyl carrier protein
VNSIDDLVTLVRDELGLPVTTQDAAINLDRLPGWDSMHLLWLLTALERTTGRSVSLPDVLAATSLEEIYAVATGA